MDTPSGLASSSVGVVPVLDVRAVFCLGKVPMIISEVLSISLDQQIVYQNNINKTW